jgi:hypothetical protein
MMDAIRGTVCCLVLAVLTLVSGFRGFDHMSFRADLWWTSWLFSECLSQILLRSFVLHRRHIMIALLWNWVLQCLSCLLDIRFIPWTKDRHGFQLQERTSPRYRRKRDQVIGQWRKLRDKALNDLYCSSNVIRVIKSRRMRWAGHVARIGEMGGVYRVLVGRQRLLQ